MPENRMKNETREEARERFVQMREQEEAGLKAASEGQLRVATLSEVEEEDESAAESRRNLNERGVGRTSDDKDESAEGASPARRGRPAGERDRASEDAASAAQARRPRPEGR